MADAAVHVGFADAAFVGDDRQGRLLVDALHFAPLVGRQRLLDELDAELRELMRVLDRLIGVPAAVGVDAEDGVGVLAQLADDLEIVLRAELDLVDRPARHFEQLLHHHLDRVDADGEVRLRDAIGRQPPQLVDWRTLLFAPQVVRRLIESALSERVSLEDRPRLVPELLGIERFGRLDDRSNRFQRLAHQFERGAVVLVRRRFAEAAVDAVGQFHDQRRLHARRFA